MKEIIRVMLAEGIDVETIHEVLDVLECAKGNGLKALNGVNEGEGDRRYNETRPEIDQDAFAFTKSHVRGARKLLKNAKTPREERRAKRLLSDGLIDKANELSKQANHIRKMAQEDKDLGYKDPRVNKIMNALQRAGAIEDAEVRDMSADHYQREAHKLRRKD